MRVYFMNITWALYWYCERMWNARTIIGCERANGSPVWEHAKLYFFLLKLQLRLGIKQLISEKNDQRDMKNIIILLLLVPDTLYVIKWAQSRRGGIQVCPSMYRKGVLWYLFQRTFQFQSHSLHLWLQSSPSHVMNLQYVIGSCCSIFNITYSVWVAGLKRIAGNKV